MGKSRGKKRETVLSEEVSEAKIEGGASETLDVKIKVISETAENKTAPVLGYFPSGYDPLKNSTRSSSSVKIYRNVKSRNPKNPRMQVAVGVKGSNVNFVGTNYTGEATVPQLCNYALGVFDKESRTLKMVPIAANRIFRLEPKLEEQEPSEDEGGDEPKEEIMVESSNNQFKNLTVLYSTKKDLRRDMKREILRQTEGPPGTQEEMDKKLKAIEINKEALEAINSTVNAENVPPYNLDATSPDMAYPLDQIILKGDWDYLLDVFELAEAGTGMDPSAYPSFVCNRFDKLHDVEDESKRMQVASILSYMTHLIKFRDKHSMDGVSSAKGHKMPSLLYQKFASMFNVTSKSRIPEDKQKLLISYILVLTLFIDDFKTEPSDIAKDLRMDTLTVRTHYEYLGCKFMRHNQVFMATLPVPLQFQTLKRKRRRK
ncbi:uncharacterized protein LOC127253994 [Andrographis paniculata]|uniref:uncharacterized protein LOC127253994 n=1 Tax=Andrographis paniculata TaxID=175694 RepID=UPI0021E8F1FA|nr:uncharacterized protein LOC127253994 [Andrographis paniculata]